jgi:hypothetical protein
MPLDREQKQKILFYDSCTSKKGVIYQECFSIPNLIERYPTSLFIKKSLQFLCNSTARFKSRRFLPEFLLFMFLSGKLECLSLVGIGSRRHNTQNNDIQHNDTKHNDTQRNDIQPNDTQHNDTRHNNIKIGHSA